jgi:hypothetical protein
MDVDRAQTNSIEEIGEESGRREEEERVRA